MKNTYQTSKGITLIALIITIIVLLILAGITVNLVIGERGIFNKAIEAKTEQEISQYKEQIELARGTVAVNNLGIVTLDNLINQIYEDEIVPQGNITKLLDEEKAEVITKEGYVFIITADTTEYIEKEATPPLDLGKENIKISTPKWNGNTHKASVTITKASTAEEKVQIQYQVNGYEEGKWIVGNSVENLNHNDIVYARLWYEKRAGDYIELKVTDEKIDDIGITFSGATTATQLPITISAKVVQEDDESGVNIASCKWVYNDISEDIGTDENSYTGGGFTSNEETIPLDIDNEGNYYLHVLTVDNAGNKKETTSGPITISAKMHKHTGSDTEGGGCYTIANVHTHVTSCYTKAKCGGKIVIVADAACYNTCSRERPCGTHGCTSYYNDEGVFVMSCNCPRHYECNKCKVKCSYSTKPCTRNVDTLICGKTTSTVESYSIGCNKTESTIEEYEIIY